MSVPVNDLCENAIAIPWASLPVTIVVNTTEATDDPEAESLGSCGSYNGYNGVWYKITVPPGHNRLTFFSNDPDSLGQVVTMLDGPCDGLSYHDCVSYDWPQPDSGEITDVTPGSTYYFLLTSYDPGGFEAFSWGLGRPAPYGDACVDVLCQPPIPVGITYPIRRVRRSPHLSNEEVFLFFSLFQLDVEAGVGLPDGSDPQVGLRWSNDGGHTWSNIYYVSAGKMGQYRRRALWRRLGRARRRMWEVIVSDPVPWNILQAIVEVNKGTN